MRGLAPRLPCHLKWRHMATHTSRQAHTSHTCTGALLATTTKEVEPGVYLSLTPVPGGYQLKRLRFSKQVGECLNAHIRV